MSHVVTSLASVILSLLLVWFVVLAAATSAPSSSSSSSPPAPAPAVAPPATTTTPPLYSSTPPASSSLLPSPFVSSPLPSLVVTNPPLPTASLSENGCIAKSLQLASDCKFAFDAMQDSVDSRGGEQAGAQLRTLATALAVSRAARVVGAAASERCSSAADAFFGAGCACEPAIVVGLRHVNVVPPVAKRELMEIAKRCSYAVVAGSAAPTTPTTAANKTPNNTAASSPPPPPLSQAAGIALLEDFLDNQVVRASKGNAGR